MSRIVLTFKNNDKEKKIEEFLDSKLSPAGYLKELVWAVMNGQSPEVAITTSVAINTTQVGQANDPAEGFSFDMED